MILTIIIISVIINITDQIQNEKPIKNCVLKMNLSVNINLVNIDLINFDLTNFDLINIKKTFF